MERATLRKIYFRLVPFCFLLYILCYVDRINVSFAALTMNRDLGLSAYVYGLAAGAFFWGYCLLEVPSNIILEKVGARPWIARIMISWGLLSAATALVTGPTSFFVVRVLVGRGRGRFVPGSAAVFPPLVPAAASRPGGRLVPDRAAAGNGDRRTGLHRVPADGRHLGPARLAVDVHRRRPADRADRRHRAVLSDRASVGGEVADAGAAGLAGEALRRETHAIEEVRSFGILSAMTNPRVLILTVIFAGIGMAGVGTVLFLPQILKSIGVSNTQAGLLTSVPYVFGTLAIIGCGHLSDKITDRYWTLVVRAVWQRWHGSGGDAHDSLWVLAGFRWRRSGFMA